jgi:hypothetical protein
MGAGFLMQLRIVAGAHLPHLPQDLQLALVRRTEALVLGWKVEPTAA